jgi:hypothetical protein
MSEVPCELPCSAKLVCRRVVRKGTVYRCTAVLAKTLGVTKSAVYQSLHRYGDAEHCGTPKGGRGNNRRPIQIGPHVWPSVTAMAADLGVSRRQLGYNLATDPQRVLALVMRVKG